MSNTPLGSDLPILLDAARIQARIAELAADISRDYKGRTPHLVGVLKGAWVFMADLVRHISIHCTVDFLSIQSYGSGTTSSGEVKITKDLDVSIQGRDVLVVEDILDTGRTYSYLQEVLGAHDPAQPKARRSARQALAPHYSRGSGLRGFCDTRCFCGWLRTGL